VGASPVTGPEPDEPRASHGPGSWRAQSRARILMLSPCQSSCQSPIAILSSAASWHWMEGVLDFRALCVVCCKQHIDLCSKELCSLCCKQRTAALGVLEGVEFGTRAPQERHWAVVQRADAAAMRCNAYHCYADHGRGLGSYAMQPGASSCIQLSPEYFSEDEAR
jgi:hypothetical protein